MDWSDEEDSCARRTLKAIKNAVSHTNLRAAGRARSDSAATQKRPLMPSPVLSKAKSHDEKAALPAATIQQQPQRYSNGSSTLAARMSHGSAGEVLEVRSERPKKLTKKLTKKLSKTRTGNSTVENKATEVESAPKRRARAEKRVSAGVIIRRLLAWMRKMMC